MFPTENVPLLPQHFLLHLRRLVQLALLCERGREVIHCQDRVWMFSTEDAFPLALPGTSLPPRRAGLALRAWTRGCSLPRSWKDVPHRGWASASRSIFAASSSLP